MSNLPLQSAVIHNDDNDDQINSTNNKLSTINSRITSPLIIKRQQKFETEIANNQAYDEIHDLQSKHSFIKKTNNDNSFVKIPTRHLQSKLNNSNELMQGNYYDQTRFDIDYSSSSINHQSKPLSIDINVEDYKKTITPISTNKNSSNKNRTSSPPFGDTSESIQQGIAQSAGILLELNKTQQQHHHPHQIPMKNNNKSHEQPVINYPQNDDDDDNNNNKQRSLSSSSSSSDCSTSDSSTSNKCQEENKTTNIPYEELLNDDDDDDIVIEQSKPPLTESTILLNKPSSQTYGTQSTKPISYENNKCLPNNGYNSHGSSITTKSSSDNSGSIRTNSGSDNDEESDEEHFNNSTLSNNSSSISACPRTNDTSIKSGNKLNNNRYSSLNEQNSYQIDRSNTTRLEQIGNKDEHHLQVPRFKQLPIDDPNSNNNKLNSGIDYNILPYTSKWPSQQSANNQTNTLSTSSHQNPNLIETHEQQQQHYPKLSHNNSRQHQIRNTKKRKQSQQQDIIRTELIPGHRGDRDVDELVMFIDGDLSKRQQQQQQISAPLRLTDANKPKLPSKTNSSSDSNTHKTSSRKKSRKATKILQQSISLTNTNNENQTLNYLTSIEQDIPPSDLNNEHNQTSTTHSIIDITNQSLEHRNISMDDNNNNNNNESQLNTIDIHTTNTTNGEPSKPDWFEQTRHTSLQTDDIDSYCLSPTIINNLNSEIISEPFVTVTHRRRPLKERRQDNNLLSRTSRFPPSSLSSFNTNDKRRILSTSHNGNIRSITRNNISNNKSLNSSIIKEENNKSIISVPVCPSSPPSVEPSSLSSFINPNNEQSLEKQQSSPRLSSHSSSSSLSSLLKRQSKPPPVVFLNKSLDIHLNDVSFGFDLDAATLNESSDDINNKPSTTELDVDATNISISPLIEQTESTEISTDSTTQKSTRRFPQRNNRGPQFYSGSDIRPHHHRNYPSQPIPQSPYIDPLLLLQYNQRLANYSQQIAYMNLIRAQYLNHQSQYVFSPSTYVTTTTATPPPPPPPPPAEPPPTTTNETDIDDETNQTSSDQVQEPLLFYAASTGQFYIHPPTAKKSYINTDQQSTTIPTVYTTPPIYPPHYFYPPQTPHLLPSHTAYFQPISSPSLLIDINKSEQNNTDDIDGDDGYENSTKLYHQTRQQSSSDIMSNALQLVYSQQQRNAQTDRFNLDDLTAYLAMKWTDSVDHYEQGDSRVLLVDQQ